MRLSGVFIALCMVLIACSLGAILYLTLGFGRLEAAVTAVAALTAMMLVNTATTRAGGRADLDDKIVDLSRGTADLARQVAEIGRRLVAVEAEVGLTSNRTRAIEPVSAELDKLGLLVEQLASSVAAHENALVLMVDEPAGPALEAPVNLPAASARAAAPATSAPPAIADTIAAIDPGEFDDPRPETVVKIPAVLLLNRVTTASDIHPADLSNLLRRFGIDLIAEKIEHEGTVVDLLDFDVRFGQGFLFSLPRPVRSDVLQGLAAPRGQRRARRAACKPRRSRAIPRPPCLTSHSAGGQAAWRSSPVALFAAPDQSAR